MGTWSWFRRSDGDAAAVTALAAPHAYALYGEIARGGMATIRLARELGRQGPARVVAVKELHPQFAHDEDFAAMFRDEMRVAARVNHPNVVPILDLVSDLVSGAGQAMLVMEYVHGESVAQLQSLNRGPFPPAIAATIIVGVLHGLHAAHETKGADGESLRIIHRDVTPQNVVVGIDGRPRLLDFGVARATGRSQTTRAGQIKGKLSYVSPEQLQGRGLDRRVDIYSASVMLWEMLAGRRLFSSRDRQVLEHLILSGPVAAPSTINPAVTAALDQIVMRGLQRDPEQRFATARELAVAIEDLGGILPPAELGSWVEQTWGEGAEARARLVRDLETNATAEPAAMVFSRAAAVGAVDGAESRGSSAPWSSPRSSENNVTVNFRRSRPPAAIDPPLPPLPPSPATPPPARVDQPEGQPPGSAPSAARSGLAAALALVGVVGLGSVLVWTAVHHRARPASPIAGGYGDGRVASSVVAMPVQPLLTMLGPPTPGPRATDSDRAGPGPSAGTAERAVARRARTHHATGAASIGPGGVGRAGAPRRASQGEENRGAAHGWVARDGSCSPPYYFDAGGIKHFKPACL